MNLFLVGGAAFLLYQFGRSSQTEFLPQSYKLDFSSGKAKILVKTKIRNPGAIAFTLDRINLNLYSGENLIGNISPDTEIFVDPKSEAVAEIPCIIKGAGLISTISEINKLGRSLEIRGVIFINGIRKNVREIIRP